MDFLGREVQEGGIDEGEEEEQETFFENDFFPYSLVFSDEDLKLLAAGDSPEAEENGESPKVGSHEAVPATASNHDNDQGSKSVKDTRYLPPKTPPNSAGESEEQKSRRRAAVAAASRVTRAKRKREREALHKRNKELELEREIYLSRIAQLQTEVQTFRDTGSTNLEMENKLLRVEIRKHKAFIRTIIDATSAVPRLTPEEQFRLLHKGTESAIGQIVGLMFTSMADSSWTWSTMDTLTHDGTYQKSRMAMQPLPLGCDAQTAKRINARIEMPLRPESVDELGGKIWKIWTTEELFLKSYAESVFEPNDVKVSVSEIETGFDKFRGEFGEDFRVFHYKEEFQEGEARIRDCITAISRKTSTAFTGAAFPASRRQQSCARNTEEDASGSLQGCCQAVNEARIARESGRDCVLERTKEPYSALIICSGTSKEDAGLLPREKGVHRIGEPLIEGHVLRHAPGGEGCLWTILISLPLMDKGFAVSSNERDILNQDLSPGSMASELMSSLVGVLNSIQD